MSLPVRPQQHSSASAQMALHPGAMRKSVMGTGAGDMRNAVQQAAKARQSGRGGRVMGGLSVGPTGQAQMPFANAQHSVSGQRGRNAPTINDLHSAQQQQQQPLMQESSQRSKTRFIVIYSSQNPDSLYAVQKLAERHRAPHPRVFQLLASVVDAQRPPNNESHALVRKLQTMPQFRTALGNGCVLFDAQSKRAYDDASVVDDMLQSHKSAIVAQFLDDYFNQQQSAQSNGAAQRSAGNGQSTPLSTDYSGGGLPTRRGVVNIGDDEPQTSVHAFARRSVVGNMSHEELERMAESANRYIRRDGSGGGRPRSSAAAKGADAGGPGGTLFDMYGNQQGGAEGGAEGSLQQLNVKAMRQ